MSIYIFFFGNFGLAIFTTILLRPSQFDGLKLKVLLRSYADVWHNESGPREFWPVSRWSIASYDIHKEKEVTKKLYFLCAQEEVC